MELCCYQLLDKNKKLHYLFIVCLAIAEFDSQTGTAQAMDITTSGAPIPGPDEIPMPSDIKPPGTEESQPGNGFYKI